MHQDYRDAKIKELRDQQARFAPKTKKVEQAALAEKLLGEIAKDRNYSFDYVCFRVTNIAPTPRVGTILPRKTWCMIYVSWWRI